MLRKLFILAFSSLLLLGTIYGLDKDTDHLSASFHGVMIADSELRSSDYDSAIADLDELLKSKLEHPVTLYIDGEQYEFTGEDLGITFDTYKTAEKVYDANKKFGFLKRIYKIKVNPVIELDRKKLYEALSEYISGLDGARDAIVEFSNEGIYVSKHVDGRSFEVDDFVEDVSSSILESDEVAIELNAKVIPAEYTELEAKKDASAMSVLYSRVLNLSYSDDFETSTVEMAVSPEWVVVRDGKYVFFDELITDYVKQNISANFDVERQDAIIKALPESENLQAEVDGLARDGRKIDVAAAVNSIKKVITSNGSNVVIKIVEDKAQIVNETGIDLGDMELLASGRSNFAGSSPGRVANVQFGLEEKFNNVLLSPDGVFSAIANSGKDISTYTGWSMAKVILGGEVVNGVGGGLCQCSTTVYRAALNAGMDILFRQQHTVYVKYYSEYGDGLDAAIFNANGLDFKFRNTTPSYVLIQSYIDGDDAYVNFYGTDDGRVVEMDGPYYGQHESSPHELLEDLKYNQIGWVRTITNSDGSVTQEPIISSYKGMPKK